MIKKLILLALAAMTISGYGATPKPVIPAVTAPALFPLGVSAGAFDPHHILDNTHTLRFEELWSSWNQYPQQKKQLFASLRAIVAKGRIPLLNIEPWSVPSVGAKETLLSDINAGKYDALIVQIANDLNSLGSTVYVRWGAEMDFTKEYPWACKAPADYTAAFRHFVELFRKHNPSLVTIWSPVGNINCAPYYPGDDVVDYVGFSIYEASAASTKWFGHPMSFADWMDTKYPRLTQFNKQMIIAELGVLGTPAEQNAWFKEALSVLPNYPLTTGIVYYEAQDGYSWKAWGVEGTPNGASKNTPNWTIDPTFFK